MTELSSNLRTLIIKPTLRCTANCIGCSPRRSLHRSLFKSRTLSLREWVKILSQARGMGAGSLEISGGEPTLYPHLCELIREAREMGYSVFMNTNGSRGKPDFAEQLVRSGLQAVRVSLYSHQSDVHDAIRQSKGLWAKAGASVRTFANLKAKYSHFRVYTQLVILKENILSLDALIRYHDELGSENVTVSYLEGDFERTLFVTSEQIMRFREVVLPRILAFCDDLEPTIRHRAKAAVSRIYNPKELPINAVRKGIYRSAERGCSIPHVSALILANGDVHPCNIVEYLHAPVMGNLLRDSLRAVWNSEAWAAFRTNRLPECALCPMDSHLSIPLRSGSSVSSAGSLTSLPRGIQKVRKRMQHLIRRHLLNA